MQGLFKKCQKVTAKSARRITGISIPFGGLQWADPGPSDGEIVRNFILFLEDRRVLYNSMYLEEPSQVDNSVHQIREQCTKTLQSLREGVFAFAPIRAIRAAGRRFLDDKNMQFQHIERHHWREPRGASAGFFAALGAYRATVGQQVAFLAAHYDLDIEGDLALALPIEENQAP